MTSETIDFPLSLKFDVKFRYVGDGENIYAQGGGLAYATPSSAGADLRACFSDDEIIIPVGGRYAVPTGVAIEPSSCHVAGFVYSRSGLGTKRGLTVSQGVGVIDPDYRGEIFVSLLNTSGEERTITRGERIAQLVFQPFLQAMFTQVEKLEDTERGAGGFGSTGRM